MSIRTRLFHKILRALCFFLFSFLPTGIDFVLSLDAPVITVISSRDIKPYQDATSGFKDDLQKSGYQISPARYNLDNIEGKEAQAISEIRNLKPNLIFTVGTEAALFAKENFKESPAVVFSMVIKPVENGVVSSLANPGRDITGVSLDISALRQFKKLKEALPEVKRVGVIYIDRGNDWIGEIKQAAKAVGLEAIPKQVNSEADVPRALDEIMDKIDCLWAQVDPVIYNIKSSQYILLTLTKNKIPLMAFSSQYVKAGALLALECDYYDIGRQAAQVAKKILAGKDPGSIAVVLPEKINLIVSRKIAEFLGINIPQKILDEAKEIY